MLTTTIDGLPVAKDRKRIYTEDDLRAARINNQFMLTGASPQMVGDIVVFLEYLTTSGAVTIQDQNSQAVTGALTGAFTFDYNPIRFDGGLKFSGSVLLAKGFYTQTP